MDFAGVLGGELKSVSFLSCSYKEGNADFLPESVDVPLWQLSLHGGRRFWRDKLRCSLVLNKILSLIVITIHLANVTRHKRSGCLMGCKRASILEGYRKQLSGWSVCRRDGQASYELVDAGSDERTVPNSAHLRNQAQSQARAQKLNVYAAHEAAWLGRWLVVAICRRRSHVA